MNLQYIVCIANSSYTVKMPKDKVTCNKYWNFYKKLKIWEDGRQPLKMGGLEQMPFIASFRRIISWKQTNSNNGGLQHKSSQLR